MSSAGGRRVERIGREHLLAALPALEATGQEEIAIQLQREVDAFLAALADHRRSSTYDARLRVPGSLACDGVVEALLAAADVLRQAENPDQEALGAWCCALAARLGATLDLLDPESTRVIVRIELAPAGDAELVFESIAPTGGTGSDKEQRS